MIEAQIFQKVNQMEVLLIVKIFNEIELGEFGKEHRLGSCNLKKMKSNRSDIMSNLVRHRRLNFNIVRSGHNCLNNFFIFFCPIRKGRQPYWTIVLFWNGIFKWVESFNFCDGEQRRKLRPKMGVGVFDALKYCVKQE